MWILCKERLPDDDESVLVTLEYKGKRYVEIGSFIGNNYVSDTSEYKLSPNEHIPIAWMPLIAPYPYEGVMNHVYDII